MNLKRREQRNTWYATPPLQVRCPCGGWMKFYPSSDVVAGKDRRRHKYTCQTCRKARFIGYDRDTNKGRR